MRTHVAMNIKTGEILETINGNHLKRCVAITNRANGFKGEWIFGHGKDALMIISRKYLNRFERAF